MELGLVPVVPVTFAFFLPVLAWFLGRRVVKPYTLTATLLTSILAALTFIEAYSSEKPLVYFFGNWPAPIGIAFEVDRMSALFALTTALIFLLVVVYSFGYMRHEKGVQYYYTALLGLEGGILGAFMTGDAFNLFVMLEVLGAASYALVAFYRSRGESVEAAFKYAIAGATGTSFYFLAMGFLYSSLGTLNMADLSAKFHGIDFPVTSPVGNIEATVAIFFALALFAFTVKSANFPGHFWLPDAHPAAPSPVSAVLSGLVVAVGVYALARFIYTVFPVGGRTAMALSLALLFLGTASAFLGALKMLHQRDVKRMIAYSTIMHMGYLFMGLSTMTLLGLVAVVYHIVNHAVAKVLLFLSAGSYIHASGTRDIEEMAGIGRGMPLTTLGFALATLSLVGVPPLNAFFSKMLLYNALLEVNPVAGAVIIVTSAMAAWAYFRALVYLWRGKPTEGHHGHEDVVEGHEDPYMAGVIIVLALAVVALGLASPVLIDKLAYPAAEGASPGPYIEAALEMARELLSGH